VAPAGCTFTIGTIEGIPLYNADVEASEKIPAAVEELKTLIGATPGNFGTAFSKSVWLPALLSFQVTKSPCCITMYCM
jgi:hypothetical protein